MSAYPQFDGFSLQDSNFITESVEYRTIPKRNMETSPITRLPGIKLLSSEFGERTISVRGYIIASSSDTLRTAIDNFHTNVTRKESGLLFMEGDRSATAIVESVAIQDPSYAQSMVPFTANFIMANPFFYGAQQIVTLPVASGTASMTTNITISGSVFAEPQITYFSPIDTGYTTTSGIVIYYVSTAEQITWSGTLGNTTIAYNDNITFDYADHSVMEGIQEVQPQGVYSRWEPGIEAFTVTFSGMATGGSLQFAYQPRYL